jgi:hypothetical protein
MEGEHMVLTESIRSLAKQAAYVISAHTALLMINIYAHEKIDFLFSLTPYTPLYLFLCFAPLVVAFLLSTRFARLGADVLVGILVGLLIYNIVTRFTALPLPILQEPPLIWKIIYEGSFGLILVSEVIALWLTIKLLRDILKQKNSPIENIPKS